MRSGKRGGVSAEAAVDAQVPEDSHGRNPQGVPRVLLGVRRWKIWVQWAALALTCPGDHGDSGRDVLLLCKELEQKSLGQRPWEGSWCHSEAANPICSSLVRETCRTSAALSERLWEPGRG